MADYTNIRVPKKVHAAIKKAAKQEGRTIISHLAAVYNVKV